MGLLLSTSSLNPTANHIKNSINHMSVTDNNNNNELPQQPQEPQPQPQPQPQPYHKPQPQPINNINNEPSSYIISLSSPWIMAIGGILCVVLSINIILLCYTNCFKNNNGQPRVSFINRSRRNKKYSKIKQNDSEDIDSEEQPINIISE